MIGEPAASYTLMADDLSGADVLALLRLHREELERWSPACKVHALPATRLHDPGIRFWSAWDGTTLAAIGALRTLDATRGELKAMRAAPAYRGRGAGRAILRHLLAQARAAGYGWLGLETGRTAQFAPALRLYRGHGFVECPAFGTYVSDEFSVCLARTIEP